MRTSRSIFLFTLLNLIGAIVFICFLPDNVIFGITGNLHASEFINKWYNLMIPITQVICTFVIMLVDVFRPKTHKFRYLISWVAIAFTTYLMWVLMFLQYENFNLGVKLVWPWTVIILFPFGLFMLAEGYYTLNKDMEDFSIFGFRWVRASALVWKRTHIIAGRSLIVTAISWIVLAILNEILWHTAWIYLVVVLIWGIAYYFFTLISARNFGKRFGTL